MGWEMVKTYKLTAENLGAITTKATKTIYNWLHVSKYFLLIIITRVNWWTWWTTDTNIENIDVLKQNI